MFVILFELIFEVFLLLFQSPHSLLHVGYIIGSLKSLAIYSREILSHLFNYGKSAQLTLRSDVSCECIQHLLEIISSLNYS
jgi:hypothetical protein